MATTIEDRTMRDASLSPLNSHHKRYFADARFIILSQTRKCQVSQGYVESQASLRRFSRHDEALSFCTAASISTCAADVTLDGYQTPRFKPGFNFFATVNAVEISL